MPDITPNLSLKKPLGTEAVSRTAYNENLDLLDANAAKASDLTAHEAEFTQFETDTATNFATKLTQINIINQPMRYGEITLPVDFRTLPFGLYKDNNGNIQHNADFTDFVTGTSIHVNRDTGNDTTGDGTSGTPYKTILKALNVISAGAEGAYQILVHSTRFDRFDVCPSSLSVTNKQISIIPDTGTRLVLTNSQNAMAWTADGTGTWKATRSGVTTVYDLRITDAYGIPLKVEMVTTLVACQATANTWYTDNVTVWIHTEDGLIPTDANFIIGVGTVMFRATLLGTSQIYFKDCDFFGGHGGDFLQFNGDATGATVVGEVWLDNCKIAGGAMQNSTNGSGNSISTNNLKSIYSFNCIAAYGNLDGFNYHYANLSAVQARQCLAFEYNCASYKHGLNTPASTSQNATTAHEGACILRLGTIGYDCPGPLLADVNDCYSIGYDLQMRDTSGTTGTGYFFSGSLGGTGIAILYNSGAIGDGMTLVATNYIEVDLINFKGMVESADALIVIS